MKATNKKVVIGLVGALIVAVGGYEYKRYRERHGRHTFSTKLRRLGL